ncbi:MAG: response regulator [Acidobacteria bacterium]|nr:response regulator [Acidobacteriota bacterium]
MELSKNDENRLRILVVDDEEMIRELARDFLLEIGCEVECAGNGREALEIVNNPANTYNLVLLDVMMPGMDGVEVLEAIHRDHPDLKIILMSAFANEKRLNQATSRKNVGFLQKPYRMADLIETVRRFTQPA